MATHVVCPKCHQRLSLHRPAIESTKIKCRHCGSKFYAGKSASFETAPPPVEAIAAEVVARAIPPVEAAPPPIAKAEVPPSSLSPLPAVAPAAPVMEQSPPPPSIDSATAESEPADEFEESEPGQPGRRKVKVKVEKPGGVLRWLVPVSVIGLMMAVVSGLLYSNRPPPLPTSQAETLVGPGAAARKINSNATFYKAELPRPKSLVGTWTVEGSADGTITFAADGNAIVNAPLMPDRVIELTSRWYVFKKDSAISEVQIGFELSRAGNHQLRLVEIDADTLLLTRYMDEKGKVSFVEHRLKRRNQP